MSDAAPSFPVPTCVARKSSFSLPLRGSRNSVAAPIQAINAAMALRMPTPVHNCPEAR